MLEALRHDRCPGCRARLVVALFAAIVCVGLSCRPAWAHKVMIFAWVEGDTIHTESKFSGGRRAINAAVIVYDKEGRQLLAGKTDQDGLFSFKIPQKTDLRIVLKASMGHQAEWRIPVEDLVSQGDAAAPTPPGSDAPPEAAIQSRTQVASAPGQAGVPLSREEMEKLIDRALDKRLEPIRRMLAESMDHGPTVSEVVGGLGYIVGLMGVAMIMTRRRAKRQNHD